MDTVDNVNVPESILSVYEAYDTAVADLEAHRKPMDGIFGWHPPGEAPCHEQFAAALEQAVDALAPEDAFAAARYILFKRAGEKMPAYAALMLEAAHGLALPLAPLMSGEQAGELLRDYEQERPQKKRLPGQEKLVKALHQRAGVPEKKGFLARHFGGRG